MAPGSARRRPDTGGSAIWTLPYTVRLPLDGRRTVAYERAHEGPPIWPDFVNIFPVGVERSYFARHGTHNLPFFAPVHIPVVTRGPTG
jgi:hypothetical protein